MQIYKRLPAFSFPMRGIQCAAYAIFLIFFGALIMVVLRVNAGREFQFLALAAVSVLSLTPVYHRFYDTRLLLLTIPAVLIVFQRRRFLGAAYRVSDPPRSHLLAVPGASVPLATRRMANRAGAQVPLHPAAPAAESGIADAVLALFICDRFRSISSAPEMEASAAIPLHGVRQEVSWSSW